MTVEEIKEGNKALISDFIHRRFPTDSNWTTGNCYHFALILCDVFDGIIYYDVKLGHFLAKIGEEYYDYHGLVNSEPHYIAWCDFPEYDRFQYERIKRYCIY